MPINGTTITLSEFRALHVCKPFFVYAGRSDIPIEVPKQNIIDAMEKWGRLRRIEIWETIHGYFIYNMEMV